MQATNAKLKMIAEVEKSQHEAEMLSHTVQQYEDQNAQLSKELENVDTRFALRRHT